MTEWITANIIGSARAELTPMFATLPDAEGDVLREAFTVAARQYRGGKIGRETFAALCEEFRADAARIATGDGPALEEVTPAQRAAEAAERGPWATMPTDGSGRMNRAERVLYAVVAVASLAVLAWLAIMTVGIAGQRSAEHDRQMIIEGGYLSWQVADGCGQGPEQCHKVLREVNANPYGIRVMEDGSLITR
jgi:hypothetical protein